MPCCCTGKGGFRDFVQGSRSRNPRKNPSPYTPPCEVMIHRLIPRRWLSTVTPVSLPHSYMRALPPGCIDWSTPVGEAMTKEALREGTMECHYFLTPHFRTQSEPIYCGQSTLAMALNALQDVPPPTPTPAPAPAPVPPPSSSHHPRVDYEETSLDCCMPREEVMTLGISMGTFACMARCCGCAAAFTRVAPLPDVGPGTAGAEEASVVQLSTLRAAVIDAVTSPGGSVLVAAYSREALGQTGALGRAAVGIHSGHYSPLGGYHRGSDSVLIMDVARFKYPPHWVPLSSLFRAMRFADPETGMARGYIRVRSSPWFLLLQAAFGGGGGSILKRVFGFANPHLEAALPAPAINLEQQQQQQQQQPPAFSRITGGICGGQGRISGAAAATMRRVDGLVVREGGGGGSPVGIGGTYVHALLGGIRSAWLSEEAVEMAAEVPSAAAAWAEKVGNSMGGGGGVEEEGGGNGPRFSRGHVHPVRGGTPLTPAQLAMAMACLPALESLPLYQSVWKALEGMEWGSELLSNSNDKPGTAPAVTINAAHRLSLLVLIHVIGSSGGGGGGGGGGGAHLQGLREGIPKHLLEELLDVTTEVGVPCRACALDHH